MIKRNKTPDTRSLFYKSDSECKRCQKPKCLGKSIYDCCDIENPDWIVDWLYRMKQSNQNKPKYESDFSKWEKTITNCS
jgi:hypothetical protein